MIAKFAPVSVICAFVLSACSGVQSPDVTKEIALPPIKTFPAVPHKRGVARSNQDIAKEFLDLVFELESGQEIARLARFEGPVTVSLINNKKPILSRDLDHLIKRFRSEADLPITRVAPDAPANIVVELVPNRQLSRIAPNAACIVVPRVQSWSAFRKARFTKRSNWATLDIRDKVAVFMPTDVSPQEARDCLHEEIAQALGPLNDLYRLPDSIYNDDNVNLILSAYDMLILRVFYAPELKSGMSRRQVAALLPRILARENPRGRTIAAKNPPPTPRSWIKQIERALGAHTRAETRRKAATLAIGIAEKSNITDHRLGFSYYVRARVSAATTPEQAAEDYARAYANFSNTFGPYDIHTARAGLQMASLALSAGEYPFALLFIEDSLKGAKAAQDAGLIFSLLAMKAEIYKRGGKPNEAAQLRTEAQAWGQYGIYPLSEIQERLKVIAKLPPEQPKEES